MLYGLVLLGIIISNGISLLDRGELQEQHALSDEIVNAITNAPIGEPIDETNLENELEGMEQEQIDNKMIGTGTVPVGDRIDRLPSVANGASKFKSAFINGLTRLTTS